MAWVIPYLLKSFFISGLLTGYYWLWLKDKRMHRYNRFYLLSVVPVSLLLPFLHISWGQADHGLGLLIKRLSLAGAGYEVPGIFSWLRVADQSVLAGAACISVWLTALSIFKIIGLYRIKKTCGFTRMHSFDFIMTDLGEAPFSFLRNLFWRTDLPFDDQNGQRILQHERVHLRERHSYDILFLQLAVCIFWMNPVFRVLRKELSIVHEFLADEQSVPGGDVQAFAELILASCHQGSYGGLAQGMNVKLGNNLVQGFSHSPVTRRLSMIAGDCKTSQAGWRKASGLALSLILLILFSFTPGKGGVDPGGRSIQEKMSAQKHKDELEYTRAHQISPPDRTEE